MLEENKNIFCVFFVGTLCNMHNNAKVIAVILLKRFSKASLRQFGVLDFSVQKLKWKSFTCLRLKLQYSSAMLSAGKSLTNGTGCFRRS